MPKQLASPSIYGEDRLSQMERKIEMLCAAMGMHCHTGSDKAGPDWYKQQLTRIESALVSTCDFKVPLDDE